MDYPNIDSVMGLPRGGLIPAVLISHELGLPYVQHPGKNTLVVDDINDTGHTLSKAPGAYWAVLHNKPTSKFKDCIYAKEVGDQWIVYPWEREDSEAIPDYLKEVEHLRDSHYIGGLTMPSGAKTSWWKKMKDNE
jgi:hypoxanthine phosphoribosyltransferase